ncbi:hypothetical protein [Stetteria hydrogenophila]
MEALLETLKAYLKRRGDIVIPTAVAAGQKRLKIAFRGLYKSLPSNTGYELFEDIVKDIVSSDKYSRELERLGLRIVEDDGEHYIEAPIDLLERLRRMPRDEAKA